MAEGKSQRDRLDFLLEQMQKDSAEFYKYEGKGNTDVRFTMPDGYEEKRALLRSLMNIRMPKWIPEGIRSVQDEFLTEEAREKGIVAWSDIPTIREQLGSCHAFADQLSVWQGDITRLKAGAIVNAANSQMLGCFVPCHRCIDNAIHSVAGLQLREECSHIMNQRRIRYGKGYEEPTGTATITKGYNLPAEYVIHTVGPIVYGELTNGLCQDLRNCYKSVLECALEHGIRSVAFCCISTGEFRFPNEEAAKIAVDTVSDFLEQYADKFDRIIFNVFKDLDRELYERALM